MESPASILDCPPHHGLRAAAASKNSEVIDTIEAHDVWCPSAFNPGSGISWCAGHTVDSHSSGRAMSSTGVMPSCHSKHRRRPDRLPQGSFHM
uniref:hypothetical protein n=1 Tax=Mycolicibacterium obuense TaxID=1807 RepID=UPI003F5844D2